MFIINSSFYIHLLEVSVCVQNHSSMFMGARGVNARLNNGVTAPLYEVFAPRGGGQCALSGVLRKIVT